MLFRRAKSLVGLDIGSSSVKAIELKPAGKGYRVSAIGVEPVPPDSIVDGAIIDGGAVADAVRRLFANKQFKAKDVVASLSGNSVIVKKITLPAMTEAELSESIYWEAEQYIPFDIQDVNLDYEILDAGHRPGHQGSMEVLLVAAKKDKIADYTNVITQAGQDAGDRRRRRVRAAERLRGQLRLRAERGRRAAQRRRQRDQHQHPVGLAVGLHPRRLDGRQRLHRSGAEGAEPAVRERRAAEEGAGRRRRHLRRRARRCCAR